MKILKSVTAFAPASVGNAGVGFDIMGFAVTGMGDKVTVELSNENTDKIKLTGNYGNLIPEERNKNTAGVAIDSFLKATGNSDLKVNITLEKNLPLGSGLGSSASSAVAAVVAINEFTGANLSSSDLIIHAMEGEKVACGAAHADNVAPSLLGGFILIRSYDPLEIISLSIPRELYSAVVHPHYELLTSVSRAALKKEISLADAVKQNANTSAFVVGMLTSDYKLLKNSFSDYIAEPYRSKLIPGFAKVKEAAMNAGAIGCSISGSGPSVFSFCRGEAEAKKIAGIMEAEFNKVDLKCDVFVSAVDAPGAKVIEKN